MSAEMLERIKGAKNKYAKRTSNVIKIREGKVKIRILTSKANEKFWADCGTHWIKTEAGGKPVAVTGCHDIVREEPCPICTAIEKAAKSSVDDESLAVIKEWKGRRVILLNVLVRSGPDASTEPQILEITPSTFSNLLSIIEEYSKEFNPLDPDNGLDFIIERKGKGKNDTEYTVMPAPKSEPVPNSTLERLHDLDEFIKKEFFRGEETKALKAIVGMTGITMSSIGGPRGTSLLTSSVGSIDSEALEKMEKTEATEDRSAEEAPVTKAKPSMLKSKSKSETKPADDFGTELKADDIDALLGELDELIDLK